MLYKEWRKYEKGSEIRDVYHNGLHNTPHTMQLSVCILSL